MPTLSGKLGEASYVSADRFIKIFHYLHKQMQMIRHNGVLIYLDLRGEVFPSEECIADGFAGIRQLNPDIIAAVV